MQIAKFSHRVYVGCMTDHVNTLRSLIEKAAGKVTRYKKTLESAESELRDMHTALRVIEGLSSESVAGNASAPTTMARQIGIAEILGVGRAGAKPPSELYATYHKMSIEDITIDTFRTTIWRMKGKTFEFGGQVWDIEGDSGMYWKEPHESGLRDIFSPQKTEQDRQWDEDLDAPF